MFKPPKLKQYQDVNDMYNLVVKKSLNQSKREREQCENQLKTISDEVLEKCSFLEKHKLKHLLKKKRLTQMEEVQLTHNRKLLNLWMKQRSRSPECIINRSERKLSVEEKNVLYRGLQHHILPKRMNADQLKVNVEKLIKTITWQQKKDINKGKKEEENKNEQYAIPTEVRDEVKGLIRNFVNSSRNVCDTVENRSFHRNLTSLSSDPTIAVTRFDKGNGVCILSKEEYLQKLDNIVNDCSKFSIIPENKRKNARHPLLRRQEIVKEQINKHVKKFVAEEITKQLLPSGCNIGKLYGTCKVHKDGYPIRPIVSMINTPEYQLAKFLDQVIKPNIPAKYSICSNAELIERLSVFEQKSGDHCVSFDVVSLFTNIPLDETITLVANAVYSTNAIKVPPMPKPSFVALLRIATGGIFSHREKLYQQCDGVSMGNPLAPTLANFFLGVVETELLEKSCRDDPASGYPVLYVRYVDDIFCIFREGTSHTNFLDRLNHLHQNLSFTCEIGGSSMPFLDINVTLKRGQIQTSVYRKATNTDVLLHYRSATPLRWKTALVSCFLHRATVVCSDQTALDDEIDRLRQIFFRNGYPKPFFDKTKDKFFQDRSSTDRNIDDKNMRQFSLKVPYVGKPSILFAKRMRQLVKTEFGEDIGIVYGTEKVGNYFCLKDKTPQSILSKVVYQFSCPSDSGADYIGYTSRTLGERVKEHCRGGTAVSDHIGSCNKCRNEKIGINNFKVLKKCRTKFETMIFEAFYIKRKNPKLNHQLVKPGISYTLTVFS